MFVERERDGWIGRSEAMYVCVYIYIYVEIYGVGLSRGLYLPVVWGEVTLERRWGFWANGVLTRGVEF